jgi:hypothetical protein
VTTNERQLDRGSKPAGRGKKHSIGDSQLGPTSLTAYNRQLVAKHHDLQLLELLGAKT